MLRDADQPRSTNAVAIFATEDGALFYFPLLANFANHRWTESDDGIVDLQQQMTITIGGLKRTCTFQGFKSRQQIEAEAKAAGAAAEVPEPALVDDRLHVERVGSETAWQAAQRAAEARARQALAEQRNARQPDASANPQHIALEKAAREQRRGISQEYRARKAGQ